MFSKTLLRIAIVLSSLPVLFSCEKDKLAVASTDGIEEAIIDNRNDIPIDGLPDWFREYIASTYGEEDLEKLMPLLNPRWEEQAIWNDTTVVVPASYFFSHKPGYGRLFFQKYLGNWEVYLYIVVPDTMDYIEKRPEDFISHFDGNLFTFDLNSGLLDGIRYEEGHVVGRLVLEGTDGTVEWRDPENHWLAPIYTDGARGGGCPSGGGWWCLHDHGGSDGGGFDLSDIHDDDWNNNPGTNVHFNSPNPWHDPGNIGGGGDNGSTGGGNENPWTNYTFTNGPVDASGMDEAERIRMAMKIRSLLGAGVDVMVAISNSADLLNTLMSFLRLDVEGRPTEEITESMEEAALMYISLYGLANPPPISLAQLHFLVDQHGFGRELFGGASEEEVLAYFNFLVEKNFDDASIQGVRAIISLINSDQLVGPYTDEQRQAIIETHFSFDPDQYVQFITHCILLRTEWENNHSGQTCGTLCQAGIALEAYWKTMKGVVHTAFDICGLIPVAGEPCDLVNGTLYIIEGDGVNATISFAGSIPFLGWGATGVKFASIIIAIPSGVEKTLKITKQGGKYVFSHKSQFRQILGITDPDKQAHHLVAWASREHDVVQKAADAASSPFHMNHPKNGLGIETWRNQPNHNNYNSQVTAALDQIKANLESIHGQILDDIDPNLVSTELKLFQDYLRNLVSSNPNLHLDDLIIDYP